jgi:hypothetical protein
MSSVSSQVEAEGRYRRDRSASSRVHLRRPSRSGRGRSRKVSAPTSRRDARSVVSTEPFPAASVVLETLPTRWRGSFDAAATALAAAGRCGGSSGLATDEIARRSRLLAAERDAVSELLDVIAREEHVHFRRPLSAPPATNRALGLPRTVRACLFDLDGVLTGSAPVHAAAWRDTLDRFMHEQVEETHHRFPARFFDLTNDTGDLAWTGSARSSIAEGFTSPRAPLPPRGEAVVIRLTSGFGGLGGSELS